MTGHDITSVTVAALYLSQLITLCFPVLFFELFCSVFLRILLRLFSTSFFLSQFVGFCLFVRLFVCLKALYGVAATICKPENGCRVTSSGSSSHVASANTTGAPNSPPSPVAVLSSANVSSSSVARAPGSVSASAFVAASASASASAIGGPQLQQQLQRELSMIGCLKELLAQQGVMGLFKGVSRQRTLSRTLHSNYLLTTF